MIKELCYVTSLVAHHLEFKDKIEDNPFGYTTQDAIRDNALQNSKIAKDLGYIPISTPLMWLGLYDDNNDRDLILNNCLEVLKKCNAILYKESEFEISEGIKLEVRFAKQNGLKIIKI